MPSEKRKMPKRWFGLHVRDTDSYLRKLEHMQRLEAEEAELKLREQRKANEQLRGRLEELKKQTEAAPASSEMMSLLLERLNRSIEAIDQQGEAEVENLRRLQERKRSVHEKQMNEWDKQSEEYRLALDFLLEEAGGLLDLAKRKREREPLEQLEREAAEAMQATPERQIAWEEEERSQDETAADLLEAESAVSAKVLQFKLRSILKDATGVLETERSSVAPMTADGMSMEGDSSAPEKVVPRATPLKPSAFWGDIDSFLEEPDEEGAFASFASNLPDDGTNASYETELTKATVGWHASAAPAETETLDTAEPLALESPGLSEEIVSLQHRYIVGKAAGENLYAADGRLIIAKGRTITAETVQAAEREGKLPDLIVQMVIPGFGEEE